MRDLLVACVFLAIGAMSVSLGLFGGPVDGFTVTDVSAMRITQDLTKRLTVYRITCDGDATALPADPNPAASVTRVDFEVDGKHVTVWIRED